jgi:hypothetical protein
MRAILLLSTLAVIAACDNGNSSTAPGANRPSPSASASGDVQPGSPSDAVAGAKPQSGFTTITTVTSASGILGGAGNVTGWPSHGTLAKACPAGTQVVGGGYTMTAGTVGDLHVEASVPDGANGWKVTATNTGSSGSMAYFTVTAICVQ